MAAPEVNDFEGGSNGTTITTANAGGAGNTQFDAVSIVAGGTLIFDTTHARGTLGCKVATAGTAGRVHVGWTTSIGSLTTIYIRLYLYITAWPAATLPLVHLNDSGDTTTLFQFQLLSTGKIRQTYLAGASAGSTTMTMPLNQWVRIEGKAVVSATAGMMETKVFKTNPDGTSPDETLTSAGNLNTGTTAVSSYRFGALSTVTANLGPVWVDNVGVATTGYLGSAAPPSGATAGGWGIPLVLGTSTPSGILVPSSGCWFGGYQSGNLLSGVTDLETSVGRQFDVVKRYMDSSNLGTGVFPATGDDAAASAGRIFHLSWSTDIWGTLAGGMPAPDGQCITFNRKFYTWAKWVDGTMDTYLNAVADRLIAFPHTLFIDWVAEPELSATPPANPETEVRMLSGTAAQYVAAFQYTVNKLAARGVTNVVWCWVVSGYRDDATYRSFYVGDAFCDWVGWDPYKRADNSPVGLPFDKYGLNARLDGGMLDAATQPGTLAKTKPRMLGEWGEYAITQRPTDFSNMATALKALPKIQCVQYFHSGQNQFDTDTLALPAFKAACQDPYLNPSHT